MSSLKLKKIIFESDILNCIFCNISFLNILFCVIKDILPTAYFNAKLILINPVQLSISTYYIYSYDYYD